MPFRLGVYFLGFIILFNVSCKKSDKDIDPMLEGISTPVSEYNSTILHEYAALQLKIIPNTPGYEMPVAARSMAYMALAAYEAAVPGMPKNESLGGKLVGFDGLPEIDKSLEYNWPMAINTAEYTLMKKIYGTTSDVLKIKMDTLKKKYEQEYKVGVGSDIIERSVRFGANVAQVVWEYSQQDGGHAAYDNNFPKSNSTFHGVAIWKPTGDEKRPLLPNWGKVRTFSSKNNTLSVKPSVDFSFENSSSFFEEAKNVYQTSKSINNEQKTIMEFWEMPSGSASQAGNQLALMAAILNKENYPLDKSIKLYLKATLTMHDALVVSWKNKYENNLMRPQTYIRQAIDPKWTALQDYSPVPDFTSEQSTLVTAVARIFAEEFGEFYTFEAVSLYDITRKRAYKNFSDYSKEAQMAPIYAGLHYKMSSDAGAIQGLSVAKNIIELSLKKEISPDSKVAINF
jgi:hypothetical protein